MKYINIIFILMIVFLPSSYAKNRNIGLVDSRVVYVESEFAKKHNIAMEKKFSVKIKLLEKMIKEVQDLEQDLKKNELTYSKDQIQSKNIELKRKFEDIQMQRANVISEREQLDQKNFMVFKPELEAIIEKVSKNMGFDIIIEKPVTRYSAPELDITQKILEEINKDVK